MNFARNSRSRRTWLKHTAGISLASALPFGLEALAPSRAAAAETPRLLVYYLPNGRRPEWWLPTMQNGKLTFPKQAAALQPFAEQAVAITNLDNAAARKSPAAAHAMGTATVLTGSAISNLEGIKATVSVDQLIAEHAFDGYAFSSVQLSAGEHGVCDVGGASCAYTQSISYRAGGQALSPTIDARSAFVQLFSANGLRPADIELRKQSHAALMDRLRQDTRALSKVVSREDQRMLENYLHSADALNARLQQSSPACAGAQEPSIALAYAERVQTFHQLIAQALRCARTPVISFMLEFGLNARTYGFIGAPYGHHRVSHYRNDGERAQLEKIETWQATMLADQLTALQNTPSSAGRTLLDDTLVLAMPSMGEGWTHDHAAVCPILFGGRDRLAQHQRIEGNGKPLTHLHTALLDAYDVEGRFGRSGARFGDDGNKALPGVFRA